MKGIRKDILIIMCLIQLITALSGCSSKNDNTNIQHGSKIVTDCFTTETTEKPTTETTKQNAVNKNWLYEGYWFYPLAGGESTDIFVFQFIDDQTFNFTSYYDVPKIEVDWEPKFSKEKYLLSNNKQFGKYIGTDWTFVFDNNKEKLYVNNSEGGYDEVLNYNKISDKNLKNCLKKYNSSNKYTNFEFDDSNVFYDLNKIQLDYELGKENINGNPSTNPCYSKITYQDGYYYYFDDDCYIRKVKKNELAEAQNQMALYSDYTTQHDKIFSICVSKNHIYYSVNGNDGYDIYSMPTSYINGFSPSRIATSLDASFYINNNKLYYLSGKDISNSSKEVYLCSIDLTDFSTEKSICKLGTIKDKVNIYLDGVSKGYAYITKEDKSGYNTVFKYTRIKLSDNSKIEFTPSSYAAHKAPHIINGKLYFILNEYADYMYVDFDKKTTKRINPGSSLGWSWSLVAILGEEAILTSTYDNYGSYVTTLKNIKEIAGYNSDTLSNGVFPDTFSGEDIGYKLTDDKVGFNSVYKFGNTLFYIVYSGQSETMCKINTDGTSWCKVADLSSE